MKKVKLFSEIEAFEQFVNSSDIEILQVDIKVVEQSHKFTECFAAVVFYKEVNDKIINVNLLDTKVEHMDLRDRTINGLKRNGIETLGELLKYSKMGLTRFRHIGDKTIQDIEMELDANFSGLKLKTKRND